MHSMHIGETGPLAMLAPGMACARWLVAGDSATPQRRLSVHARTRGWFARMAPSDATAQDEFVMIESQLEDGSSQQIVYRNGGDVTVAAVERLCNKVLPAGDGRHQNDRPVPAKQRALAYYRSSLCLLLMIYRSPGWCCWFPISQRLERAVLWWQPQYTRMAVAVGGV